MAKCSKERQVHSVVVAIAALNNLVPLLKSFIANVLKCKASLKAKFKCLCATMCSLVMSPFLRDFIKTEIHLFK